MIGLRAVLSAVACEILVTALSSFLLGFSVFWAALLALPLAALVLVFLSTTTGVDPSWRPLTASPTPAAHLEASTLAGRLADAANDQSRFRNRIQPRLAGLALARLRQRPDTAAVRDLRDPRAAAALGRELHDLLTDPRAAMPAPARLAELLDRLEKL